MLNLSVGTSCRHNAGERLFIYDSYQNVSRLFRKIKESEIRRLDREEAVNEGYNSGKLDGIEQNRTEMIMNMYNDSLDLNIITKYANLSIQEVKNIIDNNKGTN